MKLPLATSSVLAFVATLALVGCASSRAGVTTTSSASDVARSSEPESAAAPAAREATPDADKSEKTEKAADTDKPVGQLVCRVKDAYGTTSELYIDWKGKEGTGVLRQLAASGMEHEQRVRAEREGEIIFADDVKAETDLLVHTATVTRRDGKGHMRLGDMKQPWSPCE